MDIVSVNFNADLQRGKIAEDEFIKVLSTKPELAQPLFRVHRPEGNFAPYDYMLYARFELKHDQASKLTCNLCFETKSVRRTEADYIVYRYYRNFSDAPSWLIFRIDNLRADLKKFEGEAIRLPVGDQSNNWSSIYKIEFVENNFRNIRIG